MFHSVYVLESEQDKSLYIGYTNNIGKRIKEHNRGINFSTKSKLPWRIIFIEAYLNKSDALRRENYLKTSIGSRVIRLMLKEYFTSRKVEK